MALTRRIAAYVRFAIGKLPYRDRSLIGAQRPGQSRGQRFVTGHAEYDHRLSHFLSRRLAPAPELCPGAGS